MNLNALRQIVKALDDIADQAMLNHPIDIEDIRLQMRRLVVLVDDMEAGIYESEVSAD